MLHLSDAVIALTWERGLWYCLDALFDLLIDEYEEEEVPPYKAAPIADEIRKFGRSPNTPDDIRAEFDAVAAFLEAGKQRGTSVWIIL